MPKMQTTDMRSVAPAICRLGAARWFGQPQRDMDYQIQPPTTNQTIRRKGLTLNAGYVLIRHAQDGGFQRGDQIGKVRLVSR